MKKISALFLMLVFGFGMISLSGCSETKDATDKAAKEVKDKAAAAAAAAKKAGGDATDKLKDTGDKLKDAGEKAVDGVKTGDTDKLKDAGTDAKDAITGGDKTDPTKSD